MARRLREFEPSADFYGEPNLQDALGYGLVLLHLLDPNESRFVRMRSSIEALAEQVTGSPYPTWERLTAAIDAAQAELEVLGEQA